MPIYSIKNDKTGEVYEVVLSYTELQDYLRETPDVQQIFTKFPSMGDPVRLGRVKIDDGFNDVLKSIKSKHHQSTVNTK